MKFAILLVVVATFSKLRQNVSFNRTFRFNFAPPVTEITRSGRLKFQQSLNSFIIVALLVLPETRMNYGLNLKQNKIKSNGLII